MENKTIFDEEMETGAAAEVQARRPWVVWSVGGGEYHLKLTTASIRKLEQQYKKSLLGAVLDDGIPPIGTVITLLQAAMQKYHHGITSEKIEGLLDDYFDAGGTQITLLQEVIYPLMHDAGFFTDAMMAMITSEMANIDTLL